MESVISNDGTRIAYYRGGSGSPLVLIHGTGGSNPAAGWPSVMSTLEQQFRVYAVDRRGRRDSGDHPLYAIEREFEDVAAVVDSIGEPVNLLGHSFGGLCALEAALLTRNIRRLILYEPAVNLSPAAGADPDPVIEKIQDLVDEGHRDEALILFYSKVAMMPPDEIEQLKGSTAWAGRVMSAHTLPREMRAYDRYVFNPEGFKNMKVPTLLLVGGDSPGSLVEITTALASTLTNCRVTVLPGQQHIAMITAPEMFAGLVTQFILEPV